MLPGEYGTPSQKADVNGLFIHLTIESDSRGKRITGKVAAGNPSGKNDLKRKNLTKDIINYIILFV